MDNLTNCVFIAKISARHKILLRKQTEASKSKNQRTSQACARSANHALIKYVIQDKGRGRKSKYRMLGNILNYTKLYILIMFVVML